MDDVSGDAVRRGEAGELRVVLKDTELSELTMKVMASELLPFLWLRI